MRVSTTSIGDVLIFTPQLFGDERGFFMESFNQQVFNEAVGYDICFVQDNHSRSSHGVLRGLHYQVPPHEQGKLVRVSQGCVFDVAVDIRRSSPTFGHWVGAELSDVNNHQMWIPPGLAHGFLVLSESADILYKTTRHYSPQSERALQWNDSDLGIHWPKLARPIIQSGKDAAALAFHTLTV